MMRSRDFHGFVLIGSSPTSSISFRASESLLALEVAIEIPRSTAVRIEP
jgi:hypothetical protein